MRIAAGLSVLLLVSGVSGFTQTTGSSRDGTGAEAAGWVCSTTPLADKGGNNGQGSTQTVCSSPVVEACPLRMHVGQRPGGTLVATDSQGRRTETFAARLKLDLKDERPDRNSQRMVSATVTVRGWNPQTRVLPLDGGGGGKGNVVRTMTVALTGGGLPDASADLELPGITAARMVRLESVTFDDGEVWSFRSCQAVPDLYMPVSDSK